MPVIRQRLQFQYFIMRMQLTAFDHIFNCIRPVIMHFVQHKSFGSTFQGQNMNTLKLYIFSSFGFRNLVFETEI